MDIKRFQAIFIDEAMERLAELEEGLLRLEETPEDNELLNSIFRAAHTIKGSSGTMGFRDIAEFTHKMEEILDLMREGKIKPDKSLISLLLNATDMVRELIVSLSSDIKPDSSRMEKIEEQMEQLKNQSLTREYRIIFIPDQDLLKRGIDPSMIIEDLNSIGEIVSIRGNRDAIPSLSEIDPEKVYIRWDITLRTIKDESEIKKIFEFVEEGSEIKIIPVSEVKEELPLIGQMLVEEGVARVEDIEDALRSQKRIGEILIEKGKASKEDIERVLRKQSERKAATFKKSIMSTIRVDLKKLDQLLNLVGEMVIIHSMFQQILQNRFSLTDSQGYEQLEKIFYQLQRIGRDIQESTMSLRMLPVSEVFQRFHRLVRELSVSKNKSIELTITGEETELDKGVLEKITDPLIHLIRNAIDHGIESPEERVSKGKPPKGHIHLSAFQMGDSVYIEVEDDGRGLDKKKIKEKAIQKGIVEASADLTDEEIYNLIFTPGFSTAEEITDISGRGVGMDVVKKNIEELNGKVFIRTSKDKGTTISIKLPLTLAIIEGLTVSVGKEVFIIPITSVVESLRPAREDVKTVNEQLETINVRGEFIPLLRLHRIFGVKPRKSNPWEAIVVVTSHNGRRYGLLVDDLLGQQQIVIKNLGQTLPKLSDIAGGTILGNGRVALVLDVPGIVEGINRQVN